MSDSILLERDGGVAWVRLNRPEVFNSFNEEMGSKFLETLQGLEDPSVRSIVITGEGKAFCAGEDLKALSAQYESGAAPDHADILRRRYNPSVLQIRKLRKPVIAAVNGVAAGAGVSIALACDMRIVTEESKMVLAFSRVGLVPDSGATWLLPKLVGVARAAEIALTGESLSAARCLELGIANRVVGAGLLGTEVSELARGLAAGPTLAYGLIKELIWDSFDRDFSGHLEAEAAAQAVAGSSNDHLEGVKAFGEKRSPRFEGR